MVAGLVREAEYRIQLVKKERNVRFRWGRLILSEARTRKQSVILSEEQSKKELDNSQSEHCLYKRICSRTVD